MGKLMPLRSWLERRLGSVVVIGLAVALLVAAAPVGGADIATQISHDTYTNPDS